MNSKPEQAPRPAWQDASVVYSEVAQGLAYLHTRANAITGRSLESASFVYALIELLIEKGVITVEEIDDRKKMVSERLLKRFLQHDAGVSIQEPDQDKYQFSQTAAIDCGNQVSLCKAACCKMVFPLSRQDIEEGVIQWELGQPYIIAKNTDGYCCHLNRQCLTCTVHAYRPVPCRAYDCRHDPLIWLDFENRQINPKLNSPDWPHNLTAGEMELPEGSDYVSRS
ncbi:YkgJ family cysteine cluster protein [Pantanalinema rosaneae CENA516]|uniref:YkgJ family cysteine cluster protein n=1 Tax=Pantanalinema rosaneae TaxID=1620701 RepID=UPI003D6FB92D